MNSYKVLVFILFGLNGFFLQAQNEVVLNYFNANNYKGQVFLTWQIAAGSTCNGINVFRSTDGVEYTEIGKILGVCGKVSEPVNYDFLDGNPIINQKNYYQLELGKGIFSDVIFIDIVDLRTGYLLKPNPASSNVTLYINNENSEDKKLKIFDLNGKEYFTINERSNVFNFSVIDLPNGIYNFAILNNDNSNDVSGRLVVHH